MGWFFGRNDGKMRLEDLKYDNLRIKDYYMQLNNSYLLLSLILDAFLDSPLM